MMLGKRRRESAPGGGSEKVGASASPAPQLVLTSMMYSEVALAPCRGPSMTVETETKIAAAIAAAEEIEEPLALTATGKKPRLFIENCNPDRTVARLRDILAAAGGLYDRGLPVRLASDKMQQGMVAHR